MTTETIPALQTRFQNVNDLSGKTVKVCPDARAVFEMACSKRGYEGDETLKVLKSAGYVATLKAEGKPPVKGNVSWFYSISEIN